MMNSKLERMARKEYVGGLVVRARQMLHSMGKQERTSFVSDLDVILALPTPEREATFVWYAVRKSDFVSPPKEYVHAA